MLVKSLRIQFFPSLLLHIFGLQYWLFVLVQYILFIHLQSVVKLARFDPKALHFHYVKQVPDMRA
jgi:hypothetical protein